ncbi:hypothetical protein INP83_07110 [Mucilaginibacter sp. 21P]|uniref:MauE/DoxX family redox-associated membrane protein n=1 Tax=Mucilaginibacter sp. 21P TaxID=2778902 RepID=UPI001C58361C|nr:MauE/DoxX family redox-associated membrane protein [Mucilaginibacter sp. 21P]QXV66846.1 hypothetical protein INP83_07110 [Mucilaginibacter sp. 21P]
MATVRQHQRSYLSPIAEGCALLLIALFTYTAFAKLFSFSEFSSQMHSQVFSAWFADLLVYVIPPLELLVVFLLSFRSLRVTGFLIAAILMSLFTAYAGVAAAGLFLKMPCACGGVLQHMSWKVHFLFNLFFLLLSCIGIYTINRERSVIGKE